jgi:acyl-homoserine-lactone acylase
VNVSEACPVLESWDVRDNLRSNGAILFRRFVSRALGNFPALPTGTSAGQRPGSQSLFTRQFDPAEAVHTPSGLNVVNPLVQRALADAVADLRGAGIPLGAPLRGWQYETRAGKRIPIHGGPGTLGVFNAINVPWRGNPDEGPVGFPDVPSGTSFIVAVEFTGEGCAADARTFVTYSQSENQSSPHAADYTRAFSRKDWHDVPFCEAEIRSDPNLDVKRISAPR